MSDNALVAEPESPFVTSGTFLGYDLELGARAIASGSWKSAALAGVAGAVDLAATVADPFGALLSAGFGWLMDHINPLKRWLEDLTGDAAEVKAYSETWENIAGRLTAEAQELTAKAQSQLATASGEAVEAYRRHAESMAETAESLAETAEGVAQGLLGASQIIEVVHGIVRDIIAQICAAIVEWAAELVCTFGLATPLVIEQATTKVAAGVAKVTDKVTAVVESCQKLEKLLQQLSKLVGKARAGLDKIHPGAARGSHERGLGEGPRPHGKDTGPKGAEDSRPPLNDHTRDTEASGRHTADAPSAADIAKEKAKDVVRGSVEDTVTEPYGTASNAEREYEDKPKEPAGVR